MKQLHKFRKMKYVCAFRNAKNYLHDNQLRTENEIEILRDLQIAKRSKRKVKTDKNKLISSICKTSRSRKYAITPFDYSQRYKNLNLKKRMSTVTDTFGIEF